MQSSDAGETKLLEPFPAGLRSWAGNQAGGVRRLFDSASGRPMREVLHTHLLKHLEAWTRAVAAAPDRTPRIVLLIGGPGNGKTEAIESTIAWLDHALGVQGQLQASLERQLIPAAGLAVPRIAESKVNSPNTGLELKISIVQDASVEDTADQSRAQLLAGELQSALDDASANGIYVACVNRGVLDDAMIHVAERGPANVHALLQSIIQAVGLGGVDRSCWPLDGYPSVAVWPMDVESLLIPTSDGDPAPASAILLGARSLQRAGRNTAPARPVPPVRSARAGGCWMDRGAAPNCSPCCDGMS